jgi:hypothetical protein
MKDNEENKRLTLLEFKEEAEAYARLHEGLEPVIALSMQAQLFLNEQGIPYHASLPYFGNKAHADALCRSEEWLELIEAKCGLEQPLVTELSFCIRPFLSYLLWLAELITCAVEKHQPALLYTPAGKTPAADFGWKMALDDRPLGFLARQLAEQKGLGCEFFHVPGDTGTEDSQVPPAAGEPSSNVSAGFFAKLAVQLVRSFCKERKTALMGSESYGLDKVMLQLSENIPDLHYLSLDTGASESPARRFLILLRSYLKARRGHGSKKRIVAAPLYLFPEGTGTGSAEPGSIGDRIGRLAAGIEGQWRERFEYRGFDLGPFIARKLRTGISRYLETLTQTAARLRKLVDHVSPALVVSPYSSGIYAFLGDLAHKAGIPSLIITHGSHIPPKNKLEEIEHRRLSENLMLSEAYDYTVAQTPWAQKHADYFKASDRTFKTRPLLFASLDRQKGSELRKRLGIAGDKKIVVYAISQKKRSSLRFHVYETEDEYLASMADLVTAVNDLDNVHLVLKLHPSTEFTDREMRIFLPDCSRMTVLHREPFADVLSMADLLVSYCSTAIEDALINRIPVVLFDRWARYSHVDAYDCDREKPAEWPPQPIYYVTKPGRLAGVLAHGLEHAEEVAGEDWLYRPHLFEPGEFLSLHRHVSRLLEKNSS